MVRFDVERMRDDATAQGLNGAGLARLAQVSEMTVSRFWRGRAKSPVTAKKLADALGFPLQRYVIEERV